MTCKIQVTPVEHCLAAPPPGTAELSLPLTFSDLMWIGVVSPIQRLIFFELPISKSHFVNEIIPNLKNSLSLALEHFSPLAGNLVIPSSSDSNSWPHIRYSHGDSVPLTFAESDFRDFDYLLSDEARACNDFNPLVPQLPQFSESAGFAKVPVLAIQVTLFPEIGICIGISNEHGAGDGSTMHSFTKAWAMLAKLGEDGIASISLPSYDRDVIGGRKELDDFFWKLLREGLEKGTTVLGQGAVTVPLDSEMVRSTFLVNREDVQRLKHFVSTKRPSIKHLSAFTVVSSYVWTCKIKAGNVVKYDKVGQEEEEEEEVENFICVADCRGRGDPPIPRTYMGNCLTSFVASSKNGELSREGGLPMAAELIGEAIYERLNHKDGPFKGLDKMISDVIQMNFLRVCSIAGSPRQNYYDMDFGFGQKPKKFEFISIDKTGAFSLSGSRDGSGGLEVGLSLPRKRMDVFTKIFKEGLQDLHEV